MSEGSGITNRIERKRLRIIALSVVFILYLILGGAVFQVLESPLEVEESKELFDVRSSFMQKINGCISGRLPLTPGADERGFICIKVLGFTLHIHVLSHFALTLKAPGKNASENVVC